MNPPPKLPPPKPPPKPPPNPPGPLPRPPPSPPNGSIAPLPPLLAPCCPGRRKSGPNSPGGKSSSKSGSPSPDEGPPTFPLPRPSPPLPPPLLFLPDPEGNPGPTGSHREPGGFIIPPGPSSSSRLLEAKSGWLKSTSMPPPSWRGSKLGRRAPGGWNAAVGSRSRWPMEGLYDGLGGSWDVGGNG